MKSFLFTLAVVGTMSTTQAFSFDDVNDWFASIPKTRKQALANMDRNLFKKKSAEDSAYIK